MTQRSISTGLLTGFGAFCLATALGGCSSMVGSRVDCQVVKLQKQSGRSNSEIASALGVSESDVDSCHVSGGASDYGMPEGMGGGEAGGGAPGMGGGGGESSGGSSGGGGEAGGGGGAPSSPY